MSIIDEVIEFYRARLDEDASWALACTHKTGEMPQPFRADHRKVFGGGDIVAETRSATIAEHIAARSWTTPNPAASHAAGALPNHFMGPPMGKARAVAGRDTYISRPGM